ncbi:MAG: Crp/Fnr family transcriptional regulator [Thermincola sp.]|jgi:CRP/FNR family transcriptional regulator|nr:Crp/Fnr family transcriptional regulator [Thermincola sp.]MDT3704013.1 Crp/Fnr family transcriptional regulator [Thermincola sp.]
MIFNHLIFKKLVSSMQHHLLCLKELQLFQGLSEAEFNGVCPGKINKAVAKGQFLFRQGDINQTVYLVKSGKFKLIQNTEDGREVIICIVGPGEVLGETALFQEQGLAFSAVAIDNARLCCFDRRNLELMIENNPSFAVKIISHLAQKLNNTIQQVSESAGASVKDKLMKLLVKLANEHGKTSAEMTIIELHLTQQEIGNMLGASRVKVAQILREFREAGIIGKKGKYYTVKTDFCIQHFNIAD